MAMVVNLERWKTRVRLYSNTPRLNALLPRLHSWVCSCRVFMDVLRGYVPDGGGERYGGKWPELYYNHPLVAQKIEVALMMMTV